MIKITRRRPERPSIGKLNARYRCPSAKPFHDYPPIFKQRLTKGETRRKVRGRGCICLSFFTGDGLGCLEIDGEYEFSYGPDILDMFRRAAASSAPPSKDFCASLAQADCWEGWGTAMVAALRAPGGRPRGLRLLRKGSPSLFRRCCFSGHLGGCLDFWPSTVRTKSLPSFASATLRPGLHALS
jgi:hypothetical protein